MGISLSCPFTAYNALASVIESIVGSIGFDDDEVKTPTHTRSISFKRKDSIPKTAVKQLDDDGTDDITVNVDEIVKPRLVVPVLDMTNPRHEAAIKLQKVYKSFRTRRKLADCAVLIEQSWWKLLDFAELKRSSISYFDVDKHESAISRWSRARTRAAKVGKGLSKNGKAQKLALQHWLEAIDPRHRYGHNLHFYYDQWLHSQSKEPFFYWLDIGEGKEMNLVDKCPRSKLLQQCIKYLGPMERMAYEVVVNDGKLLYKRTGEFLNTSDPEGAKWIFVLSTSMSLYVGQKKRGTFQHSSFLAGGAASSAGRIVVENGTLKAIWPHSGHYRPTPENFQDFISFLNKNNVDLTNVELDPKEDEESVVNKMRSVSTKEDSIDDKSIGLHERKMSAISIPDKDDLLENEEMAVANRILERINSKEKMDSYGQLSKQLSRKWSTGAGPRIGCLRVYPTELQCHALEQVNLSPRRNDDNPIRSNSSMEFLSNSYDEMKKSGGELSRLSFSMPHQPSPLGGDRRC
ncbi:IQ domain-containing protein IQM2-like [Impatiens glandulifera]|uniref:IQ domain-containing protein IQM2-like n=1 Tax=Impatiens glandulifera TaxID=253017 RepID=UPI001FB14B32|nr:IQ domain-containing protein IQM2-like [Impatiens glandulifera]